MTETPQRLHAIISGRVQGVNFRYYTMLAAGEYGVTGWVRNRIEGTVEVTAEGPRPKLERLLRFLHRGPTNARVEDIEVEWSAATGEFDGFNIR